MNESAATLRHLKESACDFTLLCNVNFSGLHFATKTL